MLDHITLEVVNLKADELLIRRTKGGMTALRQDEEVIPWHILYRHGSPCEDLVLPIQTRIAGTTKK
jgi:hypothetical protein